MKIVNIADDINYDTEFIDQLLNSNKTNDVVFDRHNIIVTIKCENDIEDMQLSLIYRKLWESSYLRRQYYHQSCMHSSGNMITHVYLKISISEAISYIRQAVPPALQHLIKTSLTSIESIINVMKQLLLDDNSGQQITYMSIFRKCMRFEVFETAMADTSLDDSLTKIMGNWNCYVYMSTIQISEMTHIYQDKHVTTQLLFKLNNRNELDRFVNTYHHEITQYSDEASAYIVNAYHDIMSKETYPIYVMVYIDHIHLINKSIPFSLWIREAYKKLL